MACKKFHSFFALEENANEVYLECTEVLIGIAKNVLNQPYNTKFRSISLGSSVVANKLLPANGAMECLFEMGFKEGDDSLLLPVGTPLDSIQCIHDELVMRRQQRQRIIKEESSYLKNKKNIPKSKCKASLIQLELENLQKSTSNEFLKKIVFWSSFVFEYEKDVLLKKALYLIPVIELNVKVMKNIRNFQLECKKNKNTEEVIDYNELFLIELCNWFNTEFFTWVDTPQCTNCGFLETVLEGMSSEVVLGAQRVEKYKCPKCQQIVLFPRYNDPDKLLETRKGRCGEWANCFCLFCKSMGWDSRLVFDQTDHVWVEVYSYLKSKWIHCDPCENVVDTPLMYECGWKKKLNYIFAYSVDEIQDVTWRYSCKHDQVLKNRNRCSEQELVNFLVKVRSIMLKHTSAVRKSFVLKRTVMELVSLMKQTSAKESEEKGRISGSLAWRLLRGETCSGNSNFVPFTWTIDEKDEEKLKFELSYITSKDVYLKNSEVVQKGWKSGLNKLKSVFKKDEKDWKMSYLARQEDADEGIISWKFEAGPNFVFGSVNLEIISQVYESGVVLIKLCSDNTCILVPNGKETFSTNDFLNSKSVELVVELFSGTSWQHAQILRQSFVSEETTFKIIIDLIKI